MSLGRDAGVRDAGVQDAEVLPHIMFTVWFSPAQTYPALKVSHGAATTASIVLHSNVSSASNLSFLGS